MTDQSIDSITNDYYASLANTDIEHQKCVILFSGVPGSGKSKIAQIIEEELGAVRISNDDIRDLIVATYPTIDENEREKTKLKVATKLLERLETARNGMIVFDASVDRPKGYDFYNSWAQNHGYRTVLLRLDVPRDVIERRIRERGDTGYRIIEQYLANLDIWLQQWQAFGEEHKSDLVITPSTSIEDVLKVIKKKISMRSDDT